MKISLKHEHAAVVISLLALAVPCATFWKNHSKSYDLRVGLSNLEPNFLPIEDRTLPGVYFRLKSQLSFINQGDIPFVITELKLFCSSQKTVEGKGYKPKEIPDGSMLNWSDWDQENVACPPREIVTKTIGFEPIYVGPSKYTEGGIENIPNDLNYETHGFLEISFFDIEGNNHHVRFPGFIMHGKPDSPLYVFSSPENFSEGIPFGIRLGRGYQSRLSKYEIKSSK